MKTLRILLDISLRNIEEGRLLSSLSAQQIQGYIAGSKAWRFMTQAFSEVMIFSALADLANTIAHSRADLCTYIRTVALIALAKTPDKDGSVEETTEVDVEAKVENTEHVAKNTKIGLTDEQKQKISSISVELIKSRLEELSEEALTELTSDKLLEIPQELQNVEILLGKEFTVAKEELSHHQTNILEAIRRGNLEESSKLYHTCMENGFSPEQTLMVLVEHSDMSDFEKMTIVDMTENEYIAQHKIIHQKLPGILKNRFRESFTHKEAVEITEELISLGKFDGNEAKIQTLLILTHKKKFGKKQANIYISELLSLTAEEKTRLTKLTSKQYNENLFELKERYPNLFEPTILNKLRCRRVIEGCLPANKPGDTDQAGAPIPEAVNPNNDGAVGHALEVDGAKAEQGTVEMQSKLKKLKIPPIPNPRLKLIQHIETEFETHQVGIPIEHAVKLQQVAWSSNTVFGIRPVDGGVRTLIKEGYPSKDIRVKGKSSNWGPQNGFICIDQNLSKKEGNAAAIEQQNLAIQAGLLQGHFSKTPLIISDQRIVELENLGSIRPSIYHANGDIKAGSLTIKAKADRGGQSGNTYTFMTVPISPGKNLISRHYIDENGVEKYDPVEVVAEPHLNEALTADYDLFFVAGRVETFGIKDYRSVSQGKLNVDEVKKNPNIPRSKSEMSDIADKTLISAIGIKDYPTRRLNILQRFKANEDKPLGAISSRVRGLMDQINRVLDRGEYREMVHHGEDAANPASDMADNFPATFYFPKKMKGTYKGEEVTLQPVTVLKNLHEYEKMISVLKENHFHFTENSAWPNVNRPSFEKAKNKFELNHDK